MTHHNKFQHESQDARRRDQNEAEHPERSAKHHTKVTQGQGATGKRNKKK